MNMQYVAEALEDGAANLHDAIFIADARTLRDFKFSGYSKEQCHGMVEGRNDEWIDKMWPLLQEDA